MFPKVVQYKQLFPIPYDLAETVAISVYIKM